MSSRAENKLIKWIEYFSYHILSTAVILTSNTSIWRDSSSGLTVDDSLIIAIKVTVLITIGLILIKRTVSISKEALLKAGVVGFCLLTYLVFNTANKELYVQLYLVLLSWLFLLICVSSFRLLANSLSNTICLLAVLSLIFYLFGSLFDLIKPLRITNVDWGTWNTNAKNYYYLYYESQNLKLNVLGSPITIVRNCGPFPEAPMFNIVLCIGVGIEVLVKERPNIVRVILLVITIATTFSTTGMVYLCFIAAYKMIFDHDLLQKVFRNKTIRYIGIVFLIVISSMFIAKLTTERSTGSADTRLDHIFGCFRVWMNSSFSGVGFVNESAVMEYLRYKQGLSVGLPYMLSCGGVLLSSVVYIPLIFNGLSALKTKRFKEFAFEIGFLLLQFLTIYFTTPLYLMMTALFIYYESKE